jgi:DNA polymerase (family 10)
MILSEAENYAKEVCEAIRPFVNRAEVVGSIRRRRPEINDVDIIAIPPDDAAWRDIPRILFKKLKASIVKRGNELITVLIPDKSTPNDERTPFTGMHGMVQVDLYRATPETWGVLELIRTGSKEHNVKLCAHALMNHMMLSAAKGVIKEGKVIASVTEQEIFAALNMPYIEPQDREVQLSVKDSGSDKL